VDLEPAIFRHFRAAFVVGAFALAGCSSTAPPVIGAAVSQPSIDLGQAGYTQSVVSAYTLRPSDRVSINVFREPDLSIENVQLGVGGEVSLPMLGSIAAAGLTTQQLERDISSRLLAQGLRDPFVSVNIAEYASHLVTVEGAVEDPGVYRFNPGARLSAAIALADGPTNVAKRDQLAIFRESPEGIMVAKFNYDAVSRGTMLDPVLQPGDRVILGTDGLASFYQNLLRALPTFGVFGAAAINN